MGRFTMKKAIQIFIYLICWIISDIQRVGSDPALYKFTRKLYDYALGENPEPGQFAQPILQTVSADLVVDSNAEMLTNLYLGIPIVSSFNTNTNTSEQILDYKFSIIAIDGYPILLNDNEDVHQNNKFEHVANAMFKLEVRMIGSYFLGLALRPRKSMVELINRERKSVYNIEVQSQIHVLGYQNKKTLYEDWTVIRLLILDKNDMAPFFETSDLAYYITLTDETQPFTTLLRVRAWDADSGINSHIRFSLSEHACLQQAIEIDPYMGNVLITQSPTDLFQCLHSQNGTITMNILASDSAPLATRKSNLIPLIINYKVSSKTIQPLLDIIEIPESRIMEILREKLHAKSLLAMSDDSFLNYRLPLAMINIMCPDKIFDSKTCFLPKNSLKIKVLSNNVKDFIYLTELNSDLPNMDHKFTEFEWYSEKFDLLKMEDGKGILYLLEIKIDKFFTFIGNNQHLKFPFINKLTFNCTYSIIQRYDSSPHTKFISELITLQNFHNSILKIMLTPTLDNKIFSEPLILPELQPENSPIWNAQLNTGNFLQACGLLHYRITTGNTFGLFAINRVNGLIFYKKKASHLYRYITNKDPFSNITLSNTKTYNQKDPAFLQTYELFIHVIPIIKKNIRHRHKVFSRNPYSLANRYRKRMDSFHNIPAICENLPRLFTKDKLALEPDSKTLRIHITDSNNHIPAFITPMPQQDSVAINLTFPNSSESVEPIKVYNVKERIIDKDFGINANHFFEMWPIDDGFTLDILPKNHGNLVNNATFNSFGDGTMLSIDTFSGMISFNTTIIGSTLKAINVSAQIRVKLTKLYLIRVRDKGSFPHRLSNTLLLTLTVNVNQNNIYTHDIEAFNEDPSAKHFYSHHRISEIEVEFNSEYLALQPFNEQSTVVIFDFFREIFKLHNIQPETFLLAKKLFKIQFARDMNMPQCLELDVDNGIIYFINNFDCKQVFNDSSVLKPSMNVLIIDINQKKLLSKIVVLAFTIKSKESKQVPSKNLNVFMNDNNINNKINQIDAFIFYLKDLKSPLKHLLTLDCSDDNKIFTSLTVFNNQHLLDKLLPEKFTDTFNVISSFQDVYMTFILPHYANNKDVNHFRINITAYEIILLSASNFCHSTLPKQKTLAMDFSLVLNQYSKHNLLSSTRQTSQSNAQKEIFRIPIHLMVEFINVRSQISPKMSSVKTFDFVLDFEKMAKSQNSSFQIGQLEPNIPSSGNYKFPPFITFEQDGILLFQKAKFLKTYNPNSIENFINAITRTDYSVRINETHSTVLKFEIKNPEYILRMLHEKHLNIYTQSLSFKVNLDVPANSYIGTISLNSDTITFKECWKLCQAISPLSMCQQKYSLLSNSSASSKAKVHIVKTINHKLRHTHKLHHRNDHNQYFSINPNTGRMYVSKIFPPHSFESFDDAIIKSVHLQVEQTFTCLKNTDDGNGNGNDRNFSPKGNSDIILSNTLYDIRIDVWKPPYLNYNNPVITGAESLIHDKVGNNVPHWDFVNGINEINLTIPTNLFMLAAIKHESQKDFKILQLLAEDLDTGQTTPKLRFELRYDLHTNYGKELPFISLFLYKWPWKLLRINPNTGEISLRINSCQLNLMPQNQLQMHFLVQVSDDKCSHKHILNNNLCPPAQYIRQSYVPLTLNLNIKVPDISTPSVNDSDTFCTFRKPAYKFYLSRSDLKSNSKSNLTFLINLSKEISLLKGPYFNATLSNTYDNYSWYLSGGDSKYFVLDYFGILNLNHKLLLAVSLNKFVYHMAVNAYLEGSRITCRTRIFLTLQPSPKNRITQTNHFQTFPIFPKNHFSAPSLHNADLNLPKLSYLPVLDAKILSFPNKTLITYDFDVVSMLESNNQMNRDEFDIDIKPFMTPPKMRIAREPKFDEKFIPIKFWIEVPTRSDNTLENNDNNEDFSLNFILNEHSGMIYVKPIYGAISLPQTLNSYNLPRKDLYLEYMYSRKFVIEISIYNQQDDNAIIKSEKVLIGKHRYYFQPTQLSQNTINWSFQDIGKISVYEDVPIGHSIPWIPSQDIQSQHVSPNPNTMLWFWFKHNSFESANQFVNNTGFQSNYPFYYDNNQHAIVITEPGLDRQKENFYVVTMLATDGYRIMEFPLHITVLDVNDNSPRFESLFNQFKINALLTVPKPRLYVGCVSAQDPDLFDELTYSIDDWTGKCPFYIDPYEGEIYMDADMMHDQINQTCMMTVKVIDKNPTNLPDFTNVIIKYTVINRNNTISTNPNADFCPSLFDREIISINVSSNVPEGTTIYDVGKKDVGNRVRYSIESGNIHNLFYIDETSGRIFTQTELDNFEWKKLDNNMPQIQTLSVANNFSYLKTYQLILKAELLQSSGFSEIPNHRMQDFSVLIINLVKNENPDPISNEHMRQFVGNNFIYINDITPIGQILWTPEQSSHIYKTYYANFYDSYTIQNITMENSLFLSNQLREYFIINPNTGALSLAQTFNLDRFEKGGSSILSSLRRPLILHIHIQRTINTLNSMESSFVNNDITLVCQIDWMMKTRIRVIDRIIKLLTLQHDGYLNASMTKIISHLTIPSITNASETNIGYPLNFTIEHGTQSYNTILITDIFAKIATNIFCTDGTPHDIICEILIHDNTILNLMDITFIVDSLEYTFVHISDPFQGIISIHPIKELYSWLLKQHNLISAFADKNAIELILPITISLTSSENESYKDIKTLAWTIPIYLNLVFDSPIMDIYKNTKAVFKIHVPLKNVYYSLHSTIPKNIIVFSMSQLDKHLKTHYATNSQPKYLQTQMPKPSYMFKLHENDQNMSFIITQHEMILLRRQDLTHTITLETLVKIEDKLILSTITLEISIIYEAIIFCQTQFISNHNSYGNQTIELYENGHTPNLYPKDLLKLDFPCEDSSYDKYHYQILTLTDAFVIDDFGILSIKTGAYFDAESTQTISLTIGIYPISRFEPPFDEQRQQESIYIFHAVTVNILDINDHVPIFIQNILHPVVNNNNDVERSFLAFTPYGRLLITNITVDYLNNNNNNEIKNIKIVKSINMTINTAKIGVDDLISIANSMPYKALPLFKIKAIDKDYSEPNNVITYHLTTIPESSILIYKTTTLFELNKISGTFLMLTDRIYDDIAPNTEIINITFIIIARDSGTPSLSSNLTLYITLLRPQYSGQLRHKIFHSNYYHPKLTLKNVCEQIPSNITLTPSIPFTLITLNLSQTSIHRYFYQIFTTNDFDNEILQRNEINRGNNNDSDISIKYYLKTMPYLRKNQVGPFRVVLDPNGAITFFTHTNDCLPNNMDEEMSPMSSQDVWINIVGQYIAPASSIKEISITCPITINIEGCNLSFSEFGYLNLNYEIPENHNINHLPINSIPISMNLTESKTTSDWQITMLQNEISSKFFGIDLKFSNKTNTFDIFLKLNRAYENMSLCKLYDSSLITQNDKICHSIKFIVKPTAPNTNRIQSNYFITINIKKRMLAQKSLVDKNLWPFNSTYHQQQNVTLYLTKDNYTVYLHKGYPIYQFPRLLNIKGLTYKPLHQNDFIDIHPYTGYFFLNPMLQHRVQNAKTYIPITIVLNVSDGINFAYFPINISINVDLDQMSQAEICTLWKDLNTLHHGNNKDLEIISRAPIIKTHIAEIPVNYIFPSINQQQTSLNLLSSFMYQIDVLSNPKILQNIQFFTNISTCELQTNKSPCLHIFCHKLNLDILESNQKLFVIHLILSINAPEYCSVTANMVSKTMYVPITWTIITYDLKLPKAVSQTMELDVSLESFIDKLNTKDENFDDSGKYLATIDTPNLPFSQNLLYAKENDKNNHIFIRDILLNNHSIMLTASNLSFSTERYFDYNGKTGQLRAKRSLINLLTDTSKLTNNISSFDANKNNVTIALQLSKDINTIEMLKDTNRTFITDDLIIDSKDSTSKIMTNLTINFKSDQLAKFNFRCEKEPYNFTLSDRDIDKLTYLGTINIIHNNNSSSINEPLFKITSYDIVKSYNVDFNNLLQHFKIESESGALYSVPTKDMFETINTIKFNVEVKIIGTNKATFNFLCPIRVRLIKFNINPPIILCQPGMMNNYTDSINFYSPEFQTVSIDENYNISKFSNNINNNVNKINLTQPKICQYRQIDLKEFTNEAQNEQILFNVQLISNMFDSNSQQIHYEISNIYIQRKRVNTPDICKHNISQLFTIDRFGVVSFKTNNSFFSRHKVCLEQTIAYILNISAYFMNDYGNNIRVKSNPSSNLFIVNIAKNKRDIKKIGILQPISNHQDKWTFVPKTNFTINVSNPLNDQTILKFAVYNPNIESRKEFSPFFKVSLVRQNKFSKADLSHPVFYVVDSLFPPNISLENTDKNIDSDHYRFYELRTNINKYPSESINSEKRFTLNIESVDIAINNPALTFTVQINMIDMKDVVPKCSQNVNFTVPENIPLHFMLGMVEASDNSHSQNKLFYEILPNADSDLPNINIDSSQGLITLAKLLDYENHDSPYTYMVKVSNEQGFYCLTPVSLYVLDVNDNAPTIDFDNVTNNNYFQKRVKETAKIINVSYECWNFTLPEQYKSVTLMEIPHESSLLTVTQIIGSDSDSGKNGEFEFSMSDLNLADKIVISNPLSFANSYDGIIMLNISKLMHAIHYFQQLKNTSPTPYFNIRIMDKGYPRLSTKYQVSLNLNGYIDSTKENINKTTNIPLSVMEVNATIINPIRSISTTESNIPQVFFGQNSNHIENEHFWNAISFHTSLHTMTTEANLFNISQESPNYTSLEPIKDYITESESIHLNDTFNIEGNIKTELNCIQITENMTYNSPIIPNLLQSFLNQSLTLLIDSNISCFNWKFNVQLPDAKIKTDRQIINYKRDGISLHFQAETDEEFGEQTTLPSYARILYGNQNLDLFLMQNRLQIEITCQPDMNQLNAVISKDVSTLELGIPFLTLKFLGNRQERNIFGKSINIPVIHWLNFLIKNDQEANKKLGSQNFRILNLISLQQYRNNKKTNEYNNIYHNNTSSPPHSIKRRDTVQIPSNLKSKLITAKPLGNSMISSNIKFKTTHHETFTVKLLWESLNHSKLLVTIIDSIDQQILASKRVSVIPLLPTDHFKSKTTRIHKWETILGTHPDIYSLLYVECMDFKLQQNMEFSTPLYYDDQFDKHEKLTFLQNSDNQTKSTVFNTTINRFLMPSKIPSFAGCLSNLKINDHLVVPSYLHSHFHNPNQVPLNPKRSQLMNVDVGCTVENGLPLHSIESTNKNMDDCRTFAEKINSETIPNVNILKSDSHLAPNTNLCTISLTVKILPIDNITFNVNTSHSVIPFLSAKNFSQDYIPPFIPNYSRSSKIVSVRHNLKNYDNVTDPLFSPLDSLKNQANNNSTEDISFFGSLLSGKLGVKDIIKYFFTIPALALLSLTCLLVCSKLFGKQKSHHKKIARMRRRKHQQKKNKNNCFFGIGGDHTRDNVQINAYSKYDSISTVELTELQPLTSTTIPCPSLSTASSDIKYNNGQNGMIYKHNNLNNYEDCMEQAINNVNKPNNNNNQENTKFTNSQKIHGEMGVSFLENKNNEASKYNNSKMTNLETFENGFSKNQKIKRQASMPPMIPIANPYNWLKSGEMVQNLRDQQKHICVPPIKVKNIVVINTTSGTLKNSETIDASKSNNIKKDSEHNPSNTVDFNIRLSSIVCSQESQNVANNDNNLIPPQQNSAKYVNRHSVLQDNTDTVSISTNFSTLTDWTNKSCNTLHCNNVSQNKNNVLVNDLTTVPRINFNTYADGADGTESLAPLIDTNSLFSQLTCDSQINGNKQNRLYYAKKRKNILQNSHITIKPKKSNLIHKLSLLKYSPNKVPTNTVKFSTLQREINTSKPKINQYLKPRPYVRKFKPTKHENNRPFSFHPSITSHMNVNNIWRRSYNGAFYDVLKDLGDTTSVFSSEPKCISFASNPLINNNVKEHQNKMDTSIITNTTLLSSVQSNED